MRITGFGLAAIWCSLCGILGAQPYVYTVDVYNNAVTVIDSGTNRVTATLSNLVPGLPASFANGPCSVAVTPDGATAFVGNYNQAPGTFPQLDVITAIDAKTNKATTIAIDQSFGVAHLAISPDGKFLYAPVYTGQNYLMEVVDIAARTLVKKFGINGSVGRPAVSPDGTRLWVPYLGDTKIEVLDSGTGSVVSTIKTGFQSDAVVLSPDGATAYASSEGGGGVFAIDVASGRFSLIPVTGKGGGATFVDLAITPDGNRLFVTQNPSPVQNNVVVVDLRTKTQSAPLPQTFGNSAQAPFALTPDGKRLFTIFNAKTLSVAAWDATTYSQIGTNNLVSPTNTFFPCGMAIQPAPPPAPAAPAITAVVNGASYRPPISGSAWVTIQGSNLSTTTRTWGLADFSGNRLPTSLDRVSVTINGLAAYPYYISPGQVNVLAPDDSTTGAVQVQVTTAGVQSAPFQATKAAFSPAFFTVDGTHPAAIHGDGTLVAPAGLIPGLTSSPAKPGEAIAVFGTGFGQSNPATPSGVTVPAPATLASPPTVTIGGAAATVVFAGISGSGLDQINVIVPSLPDGDAAIVAQAGGVPSPGGVVITVHQ